MKKNKKNIICLICCRGGSTKIKNKNIKKFCGKPLLTWSINNIIKSRVFDRIILSTDSKKIAQIGTKNNLVELPGLRPKSLARNNSDQFETHKYIFNKLKLNDQNSIICIFNNNPFIGPKIIKESFGVFKKNKFKGLVTDSAHVDGDYIAWKQCYKLGKKLKYIFNKKFLSMKLNRQNLKKMYVNIFNLRWSKPSLLDSYTKFKKQLLKKDNNTILLKKLENFDIDEMEDWLIAEAIFKKFYYRKI